MGEGVVNELRTLEPVELVPGQPQWIEPTIRVIAGVDPLGFQTITTDRIIPRLLPGVLALSDRARYFSFYAYLLHRYAEQKRPPNQAALSHWMKSREYEYALAVIMCPHCQSGPTGANNARPEVNRQPDAYERRESIESHLGGYGLYYRSPMQTLGLIAPAGTPTTDGEATPVDVLLRDAPHAEALAETFAASAAGTRYLEQHIDASGPIPADVLAELAEAACLCRLGDHPAERGAVRDAFFEPSPRQDPSAVERRRQGFALWLDLLADGERVTDDDGLRRAVWDRFAAGVHGETRSATTARWAGLAAKDYVQEGVTNLWAEVGPHLQAADRGDGLAADALATVARLMIPGELDVVGTPLSCGPDLATEDFAASLLRVTESRSLPEVAAWARSDGRAIAGLCLLLVMRARLPAAEVAGDDWLDTANLSGQWQPGPVAFAHRLSGHLSGKPALVDTMAWLLRTLVIRPHEAIAYSKLPEFTFRFRHEGGRLRMYPQPFGRFILNDIRSRAMTTLATDLGLVALEGDALAVTGDGRALIDAVFDR